MAILKKNAFSRRVPDLVTEELVAVLSRRSSFEFKQLFDIVHENLRARNAASGNCWDSRMLREYLPVLLQILVAILFVGSALLVSVLVGKSGKRTRAKDTAYECGMIPQGERQPRFSVKFYLVAMLFILFDLEIVFMYPWAVVYRDAIKQSSVIFWSMLSFIAILMVGYVYALKKGALDFRR